MQLEVETTEVRKQPQEEEEKTHESTKNVKITDIKQKS